MMGVVRGRGEGGGHRNIIGEFSQEGGHVSVGLALGEQGLSDPWAGSRPLLCGAVGGEDLACEKCRSSFAQDGCDEIIQKVRGESSCA
jgi:hypothetical protein